MTARQFYLTLFLFSVSLRVQKMPTLMAGFLQKDGYLLLLFYFFVDLIGICLAFFILNHTKNNPPTPAKNCFSKTLKNIILIAISIYFMLQCTLAYEAIQDLFSHVLFDNLPWALFSLLLVATILFLAIKGIRNIGRVVEMFFFIILFSYIIIAIFGGTQTDFSSILPLETIDFNSICNNFVKFNLWFGDFFVILFLGKHSEKIKLKWTLLTYSLAMGLVILLNIEFYGIYSIYSPMQSSLISVISEHSMLGVDVGRIDWFLILLTEIGTILCASLCLYFSGECLSEAFPKIKNLHILIGLVIALYIVDVIYLVDTNVKLEVFLGFSSLLSISLKVGVFIFVLLLCIFRSLSQKQKLNKNKNEKNKEVQTEQKSEMGELK